MLRDGSVVQLRLAGPGDREALARFFHGLSFESLRRRFFGPAEPSQKIVEIFCDASDPAQTVTLLALRLVDGSLRPIAVGSYFRIDASSAEVAFAVDDHFQNKGLGTVLLDRLAGLAGGHGFTRFEAVTLSDNAAMLTVFHESGFEIHSKSEHGCVTVQLSLDPTSQAIAAAERRDAAATVASLRPLLEPASVAIVGASRNPRSIGALFRRLFDDVPGITPIAHFHDTRGTAIANCIAAYDAGVRHFDSAFGGVGGHPTRIVYGGGYTGNVCTEDLVGVFTEMGIETGIDLPGLIETAHWCEDVLGRPLRGMVTRSGLAKAGERHV